MSTRPQPKVIRVCRDPIPAEIYAAKELQRFLKEIAEVEITIQIGGELPAQAILVGRDNLVDTLIPDTPWETLGQEGLVVKTAGPHLILAGGRPRGTLYAVYSFLDTEMGCRWFAPDCSLIPRRPSLDFPDINRMYIPPLEFRDTRWHVSVHNYEWAARNYLNAGEHAREELGGSMRLDPYVHTFFHFVPPNQYLKDRPLWFSYSGITNTRRATQLCLTNPEVVSAMTDAVRDWIRKNPTVNVVSVSQNDCGDQCECPNCRTVDEEEGSPSGTILRFVNQVAENMEKEFPNVAIETLAYRYSRKPPKHVKPRSNVIVRLCSIECCFMHPLATCPENASFRDDIIAWSKICNRLWVWDYTTNYSSYLQPHPNLNVLGPNIKFYVTHGVKGIYEQGNGESRTGEWAELRTYILYRQLWNPDNNSIQTRDEFIDVYYGPAAGPIRRYVDLMHNKVQDENIHIGIHATSTAPFFTPEIIADAEALFDEAEKLAAACKEFSQRVRTARIGLDYVALIRGREWASNAMREHKSLGPFGPNWDQEQDKIARRFIASVKAVGITHISEGNPTMDAFMKTLQATCEKSVQARVEQAGGKQDDFRLFFTNEISCPVTLDGRFRLNKQLRPSPDAIRFGLASGATMAVDVKVENLQNVKADKLSSLLMDWSYRYSMPGQKETVNKKTKPLACSRMLTCPRRTGAAPVTIDGKLDKWANLPFEVKEPGQIKGDEKKWAGPDDLWFRFGVEYDDDYLYFAIEVFDDDLRVGSGRSPFDQDGIEFRLDGRTEHDRVRGGISDRVDILLVALSPAPSGTQDMAVYYNDLVPKGLKAICVKTDKGHNTEIAVPASWINDLQKGAWENFRLNIAIVDYDGAGSKSPGMSQVWWKPDWRNTPCYDASGTFKRGS